MKNILAEAALLIAKITVSCTLKKEKNLKRHFNKQPKSLHAPKKYKIDNKAKNLQTLVPSQLVAAFGEVHQPTWVS